MNMDRIPMDLNMSSYPTQRRGGKRPPFRHGHLNARLYRRTGKSRKDRFEAVGLWDNLQRTSLRLAASRFRECACQTTAFRS